MSKPYKPVLTFIMFRNYIMVIFYISEVKMVVKGNTSWIFITTITIELKGHLSEFSP